MVVVEKTKRRKIVSHQLGVSMGYGDAHRLMLMRGVGIAMQRMHQSYKCMKAQQKKLVGVHPTCLLTKTQGTFEEAHHWNIQAKFCNEILPLVYESDNIGDSLCEEHSATLKHKCGKWIVALPLLSFSLIFLFGHFLFFMAFIFFFYSSLGTILYE